MSADEDHGNVQARSNEVVQEVDGVSRDRLQSIVAAEAEAAEVDDETAEETENLGSSESEAPISERAASGFSDSPPIGSPRVQFENIKEEDALSVLAPEGPAAGPGDAAPGGHEEDRKCRRHQKHEHK